MDVSEALSTFYHFLFILLIIQYGIWYYTKFHYGNLLNRTKSNVDNRDEK